MNTTAKNFLNECLGFARFVYAEKESYYRCSELNRLEWRRAQDLACRDACLTRLDYMIHAETEKREVIYKEQADLRRKFDRFIHALETIAAFALGFYDCSGTEEERWLREEYVFSSFEELTKASLQYFRD